MYKEFFDIMDEEESDPFCELIEEDQRVGANKNVLGILRFNFAVGEKQNKNNRIYSSEILKRELNKLKERIVKNKIGGCLDHPIGASSELSKISHLITDVKWDAEKKKAKAEASVLNTQKGRDLMILLNSGMKLGASMRGTGEVDQFGMVQKGYELHSVDLVANPSFGSAASISSANLVYESGNAILEGRPMLTVEDTIAIRYEQALRAGFRGGLLEYKTKVLCVCRQRI